MICVSACLSHEVFGWVDGSSLGLDYMRAAASVPGVDFIMIVKSFELFSFVLGFIGCDCCVWMVMFSPHNDCLESWLRHAAIGGPFYSTEGCLRL